MTAQSPLPMTPVEAVEVGAAAALAEDETGGRVYVHGSLTHVWPAGDETGRRLAAVQLMRTKAAAAIEVAAAFGVADSTLWRWHAQAGQGTAALAPGRRGPKGPSKLTDEVVAEVRTRRGQKATIRQISAAVGIAEGSVRRALSPEFDPAGPVAAGSDSGERAEKEAAGQEATVPFVAEGPGVLAAPAPRAAERGLARQGLLQEAAPVFTGAARVPLAGLLLSLPALQATGLLGCARQVYGALPAGFYGLDTTLVEGVFRALAGAPRAEGAARFAPVDLGRVLGMDRGPEVKTIRRKIGQLAETGQAAELLAGMAKHHLDAAKNDGGDENDRAGLVLYVDGHVRAYQGTKKIAKTHLSRLRFPAPATVETWVTDAGGDPVLVVMAEPGASLAMELRRLLPELRAAVGDDRRVLVGFDRGGWSPALFKHMSDNGFDVLTWRKGHTEDLDGEQFTETVFTDEAGREHAWTLADTTVELPLTKKDEVFTMRQITRLDTKKPRKGKKGQSRQVHVLSTRTDLTAGQVMYRMGARWRQENQFRYARMHLGLDSHDAYAASDDDPDRSVPNPAKARARQAVNTATTHLERERARADAALLAARTPAPGQGGVLVTNQLYNTLTAELRAAEDDLAAAKALNKTTPTRVPLGEVAPGQQVLDTETKLIHHAIRIAAFNTTTAIAREIRTNTGYARATQEAYTLTRQILTWSGDILPDPDAGTLTIRLDPMPTGRETRAAAELCKHLTNTNTVYPGTDLTLHYEAKNRP